MLTFELFGKYSLGKVVVYHILKIIELRVKTEIKLISKKQN